MIPIDDYFTATPEDFLLTTRLSHHAIEDLLKSHDDSIAGKYFVHKKNRYIYQISHTSILNHQNKAELAVNYVPVSVVSEHADFFVVRPHNHVRHNRPCSEFFDGRFEFLQNAKEATS
ncbi:hypothetical protein C0431_12570 [bacterium]|nr:hypothetical protein [bacterium]